MPLYAQVIDGEFKGVGHFKSMPANGVLLTDEEIPVGLKNWKYEVVDGALALKDGAVDPVVRIDGMTSRAVAALVSVSWDDTPLTDQERALIMNRHDLINEAGWDTLEVKYPA